MTGLLCLQGGGEFSAGCNEMDALLLERIAGPVVVLPLASPPGHAYDATAAHGVGHFRRLGAEAYGVPDPREGAVADVVREAGLVVLPGGSPLLLLTGLRETGLDAELVEHVARGGAVMGASAGAMVLCSSLLLPEEKLRTVEGLGLAPGLLVIPHWGGEHDAWVAAAQGCTVLGIPEESGVLLVDGVMTAVGQRNVRLVLEEADLSVGHTHPAP